MVQKLLLDHQHLLFASELEKYDDTIFISLSNKDPRFKNTINIGIV